MKGLQKYLGLIVVGAAVLFSILTFATMAGEGIAGAKILGEYIAGPNVYDFISDGYGLDITALVFVILLIVGGCAVAAIDFLKVKFPFKWAVPACLALFGFLAGLFFFLTPVQINGSSIGVGAVLSGIFAILAAAGFGFETVLMLKK